MEGMLDDLIRLRKRMFSSQRALGKASGLSREVVRRTELGLRPITLEEFVVWVEACGVSPYLFLAQHLAPSETSVLDEDRDLMEKLRHAIHVPARRKVIEAILNGWKERAWERENDVQHVRQH
jgi:transcriptional regulator with XRE-family HTH domain